MSTETIKLTPEELERINLLRSNVSYNIESIGRLYLHQKKAQREMESIEKELEKALTDNISLGVEEEAIIKEISTKYGEGQLFLETGEYKPYKKD